MNEKFNKNAKVEQLTKVVLIHGEEKGLIVKDPLFQTYFLILSQINSKMINSILFSALSQNPHKSYSVSLSGEK